MVRRSPWAGGLLAPTLLSIPAKGKNRRGIQGKVQPLSPPVQVSSEKKLTSSTVGMQTSMETSPLLKVRPVLGQMPVP